MSKFILILCFLTSWLNGNTQAGKYVLQLRFSGITFDQPSVLTISGDRGISKLVIDKLINQWHLDSLISYPQPVQIDFYADCNKDEIAELLSIGRSTRSCISTNVYLTDSAQCLVIQKDSLWLLDPNVTQVKYQQANQEISDRIELFNTNINNELIKAYKSARTQNEKDSIEALASALFKVNVARVNLDSTLFPLIKNNLNNSLSFYAINEYIRVSKILDLPIPRSGIMSMLLSMPAYQKKSQTWEHLYKTLEILKTKKTLVGSAAPELMQLSDTSGDFVHLKDFRRNIIFIDFWASWCLPCKAQLPYLKKVYDSLAGFNVVFIGISLDFDSKSWKNEINKSDLHWIQATDLKGDRGLTVTEYGITTIPHNILIDENGIVVEENIPLESLSYKIEKLWEK